MYSRSYADTLQTEEPQRRDEPRTPGKRTLVETMQMRRAAAAYTAWARERQRPDELRRHAARGIAGGGAELPYAERIRTAFGRHDVSGIEAHVGGEAAEACDTIGADAYAAGGHVAFAEAPDLHTAAHEAAHVIQQRAGVHMSGGVGHEGDPYERHADAVADAVVAGGNAEPLLDRFAPPSSAPAAPAARAPMQMQRGRRGAARSRESCESEASTLGAGLDERLAAASDRIAAIRAEADALVAQAPAWQEAIRAVCHELQEEIDRWTAEVGRDQREAIETEHESALLAGLAMAGGLVARQLARLHPLARAVYMVARVAMGIGEYVSRARAADAARAAVGRADRAGALAAATGDEDLDAILNETSSAWYWLGMAHGELVQATGTGGFGAAATDATAERSQLDGVCESGGVRDSDRADVEREGTQLEQAVADAEAILADLHHAADALRAAPEHIRTDGRQRLLRAQVMFVYGGTAGHGITMGGSLRVNSGGAPYLHVDRTVMENLYRVRGEEYPSTSAGGMTRLLDFAEIAASLSLTLSVSYEYPEVDLDDMATEAGGLTLRLTSGGSGDLSWSGEPAELLGRLVLSARDWRADTRSGTGGMDEAHFAEGHEERRALAPSVGQAVQQDIEQALRTRPLSELDNVAIELPASCSVGG